MTASGVIEKRSSSNAAMRFARCEYRLGFFRSARMMAVFGPASSPGIYYMTRSVLCLLSIASIFAWAPRATAATYDATVLYYLAPLPGFEHTTYSSDDAGTAAGGQVAGTAKAIGTTTAIVWSTGSPNPLDLDPTGTSSQALGTSGTQQVGMVSNFNGDHAALWNSAPGHLDLNPAGFKSSIAYGTNDSQQVGNGVTTSNQFHALMWNGSAASAIDLHPAGFQSSGAYATDGITQVGGARVDQTHAALWSGSAASFVDLHPAGYLYSIAKGVAGGQQVGFAHTPSDLSNELAMLWSGTAVSAVQLHPDGYTSSIALGTNGSQQVGRASNTDFYPVAMLWSGNAASAMSLHGLLPAGGIWDASIAYTIDADGTTWGVARGTYGGESGTFAIRWSPVPEPSTWLLALLGTVGIVAVRRRRCLRPQT